MDRRDLEAEAHFSQPVRQILLMLAVLGLCGAGAFLVLPRVHQHHKELGLPFGHWQFDSWFYPKDGGVGPGGGGGGVTNWTALPSVFPSPPPMVLSRVRAALCVWVMMWGAMK